MARVPLSRPHSNGPGSGTFRSLSQSGQASARRKSGGASWRGCGFYVQIEQCSGMSDKVTSVRLDEGKYMRCTKALKMGIESFFDHQIGVEIVHVPTLYAVEVLVMPEDCHPQNGRAVVSAEAERCGGKMIFSKIQSKRWPNLENVLNDLQEFCRVPVRITLVGKDLKPARQDHQVSKAVNSGGGGAEGAESLVGLAGATFHCTHSCGKVHELHTDAEGKASSVFFPGNFTLSNVEGSRYDTLTPGALAVPASFAAFEATIKATMKKQCTFFVVDHLNRPCTNFPLLLRPRQQKTQSVVLVTRSNGRVRGRLGAGIYAASYDASAQPAAAEADASREQPEEREQVVEERSFEQFVQELEVQSTDLPQFFRICVHRVRFICEIMLRTRFDEPVSDCPFRVVARSRASDLLARGSSTGIGVAISELRAGQYCMKLEPSEESPFVATSIDVQVFEDGTYTPLTWKVETKTVDVQLHLVTPDGEPARACDFHLKPQFAEAGGVFEMSTPTDHNGIATVTMNLLEPYMFQVRKVFEPAEYMPQQFVFQTDRRKVTAVVARSIFGTIRENRVVIMVDTSGSMQVYIDDVKAALNLALVEQFHKSSKHFNIVAFSGKPAEFHRELVDCSPQNIEDAMRFVERMSTGGISGIADALTHVFRSPRIEAIYLVTDGKCNVGEELLGRVRAMYLSHQSRPKLHVISINCVPERLTYRSLQNLTNLTQAVLRPVVLEQEVIDALDMQDISISGSIGNNLASSKPLMTTDESAGEETDEADPAYYSA